MHTVRRLAAPAVLAFAALLCVLTSGCSPKSASDLGHKLVVHGVVTDAALLTPLSGVKVTLLSSDRYSPLTTGADGYFQFDNVQQIDNLLVQFQKEGFAVVTVTVNPTVLQPGLGGVDGGVPNFPGFGGDVDGFDASIALSQLVLVPVAGTVYDGTNLALGASVMLATPDGVVGYQTKTDAATGRFAFPGVRPGAWTLIVLPFDRDADGLSDTQFFSQTYSLAASSGSNLGNLVVVLKDVQRALVASSFSSLSAAYPISAGTLLGGVSGVLPAPGTTLFLHFGAEVDPLLTSFELVQVEPGPRYSAPIGLTVAWDKGSVARLTAASPLLASDDSTIGYELRVRALRFKDGTPGINPSGTGYGTISFTVLALPAALPSLQPSIYFASKFTATQATVQGTGGGAGVTFPITRGLYNIYSNSSASVPATQATLNFVGENGFLCKSSTSTETDTQTGLPYRTEIENAIKAQGFFPLDVTATSFAEGTVPFPGTISDAGYAASDNAAGNSGATGSGFCLVSHN